MIAIGICLWCNGIIIGCCAWKNYQRKIELLTPRDELQQALTPRISDHDDINTPKLGVILSDNHINLSDADHELSINAAPNSIFCEQYISEDKVHVDVQDVLDSD